MKVLAVAYDPRDYGELATGVKDSLGDAELVFLAVHKAAEEPGKASGYSEKVFVSRTSSPESIALLLEKLISEEKPDIIVGEAYKNLRDALSRVAGKLDLPMATDVSSFSVENGKVRFRKGFLSEKAVMEAEIPKPAVILFLTRFTKPKEISLESEARIVELEPPQGETKVVETRPKEMGGANLEEAEIIVGVGRGFKSKEDLKLAFELAELLNAQIGCTRPIAADLKWLSEDHWIGISGKRVAPKLYLAIGISGSPQHMSGVQNAKIIVAVNKDKNAPIFKQADYGVVADLYQFIPVLIKKLKERKSS
ncbi:electron transfer flavoprotein alpha-subunit [Aeropyrum pernix]|uniref:Electron transfer flavoprotein alpha-subunit n=1 Tax=Aeropyrum pernix TaxID=56636 RepID=A0A401HB18_AERPX|nr:electron transfer flavoprotein subunit alpha/FixB family protein [Aeropyrum pernix]GBF09607.1 electron transfer flavoprotein alpha-subunit [Aeropyrum pernix]